MQLFNLAVGKLSTKIVLNFAYCIAKNLILVLVIRFLTIHLHVDQY